MYFFSLLFAKKRYKGKTEKAKETMMVIPFVSNSVFLRSRFMTWLRYSGKKHFFSLIAIFAMVIGLAHTVQAQDLKANESNGDAAKENKVITERILPNRNVELNTIKAPIAWKKATGKGVKIWILDAGMEFQGTNNFGIFDLPQQFTDQQNVLLNHGIVATMLTTMAAPEAVVTPIPVTGSADLMTAIDRAIDNGVAVIGIMQPELMTAEVIKSIEKAINNKMIVLLPAKVDFRYAKEQTTLLIKASSVGAIIVGATDDQDFLLENIDLVANIDIFAPSWNPRRRYDNTMAVPTTAGAIALLLENQSVLTPYEVKSKLLTTARKIWAVIFRTQQNDNYSWAYFSTMQEANDFLKKVKGDDKTVISWRRLEIDKALGVSLETPWYINAMNAPLAWKHSKGKDVKIALLDNGFKLSDEEKQLVVNPTSLAEGDAAKTWESENVGLGTYLFRIIKTVAPEAKIMPISYPIENDLKKMTGYVVKGLEYAIANGAKVISMSEGAWASSEEVDAVIKKATDKGIHVIFGMYQGKNPDVLAPLPISGVVLNGQQERLAVLAMHMHEDNPYHVGQSYTTPQVAGAVALLIAKEANLKPAEVKARLMSSAVPYQWGLKMLDIGKAIEMGMPTEKEVAPKQ
jgi:subtilisin family serine protease